MMESCYVNLVITQQLHNYFNIGLFIESYLMRPYL